MTESGYKLVSTQKRGREQTLGSLETQHTHKEAEMKDVKKSKIESEEQVTRQFLQTLIYTRVTSSLSLIARLSNKKTLKLLLLKGESQNIDCVKGKAEELNWIQVTSKPLCHASRISSSWKEREKRTDIE